MKKIITLICVSLFYTLSVNSQIMKEGKEKIRALKIAFMTKELNLTSGEAEKFWPIYNDYNKEQNNLRTAYRTALKNTIRKGDKTLDNINETDAKKLISLKLNTDKQLYEAQKKFIHKIEGIIPYKKIIKLQISEMEFVRKLMRKYKHRGEKKN